MNVVLQLLAMLIDLHKSFTFLHHKFEVGDKLHDFSFIYPSFLVKDAFPLHVLMLEHQQVQNLESTDQMGAHSAITLCFEHCTVLPYQWELSTYFCFVEAGLWVVVE